MTDPGTLTTAFTLTTSVAASKTRRRAKIGHPQSAVNKLTITLTYPIIIHHCTATRGPANFSSRPGPLANDLSLNFCLKPVAFAPARFANVIYWHFGLTRQLLLTCKRTYGT
jgi:hypothetical protein